MPRMVHALMKRCVCVCVALRDRKIVETHIEGRVE